MLPSYTYLVFIEMRAIWMPEGTGQGRRRLFSLYLDSRLYIIITITIIIIILCCCYPFIIIIYLFMNKPITFSTTNLQQTVITVGLNTKRNLHSFTFLNLLDHQVYLYCVYHMYHCATYVYFIKSTSVSSLNLIGLPK